MKLCEYLDIDLLEDMIDRGYINVVNHPNLPIKLYNYSKTCTIDHIWNDATCKCRGLVVDENENIIARPFVKFFNYEELEGLGITPPEGLPFDIYEKMDGSLGIMFRYRDWIITCTRGSFVSEQAEHMREILANKYRGTVSGIKEGWTYLFEIVYPEDPHVVRYGDTDDVFLLAIYNNETGEEHDIRKMSGLFRVVNHYPDSDWKTIRNLTDGYNKEGFVVRFANGFRMKIKFEYYFKLHALKDKLSEKAIFEDLSGPNPGSIDQWIHEFPEETQIWYKTVVDKYNKMFSNILSESNQYVIDRPEWCLKGENIRFDAHTAEYYKNGPHPSVIFMIAKEKDPLLIRDVVWKEVSKMI